MNILSDKTGLGININLYNKIHDNYEKYSQKATNLQTALKAFTEGNIIICKSRKNVEYKELYDIFIYAPEFSERSEHVNYNKFHCLRDINTKTDITVHELLNGQWYIVDMRKVLLDVNLNFV
jgi:hypothetical protein